MVGVLHKGLTKNLWDRQDDWDDKVPVILWAYRTTYKRSTGKIPFKLVYGQEVVIPLHFWENAERVASVLRYDHTLNTKQHFYQLKTGGRNNVSFATSRSSKTPTKILA
jgi:hypothetical protein